MIGARQRARSGRVTLQGVHLRGPAAGAEVLAGISLALEAGELVVLVGPPGSGKTHLLRVLAGSLVPAAGTLRLDGLTPTQRGLRTWQASVALASAGDVPCAGSVADNIRFPSPRRDAGRLAECVRLAQLGDELAALARGVNTPIDDVSDAERALLWPRIALARALYRRPKVLLWDEVGGWASGEATRRWWQAVRGLTMTRLVVVQGPEAFVGADRVLVLGEGRVLQDLRG